MTSTMTQVHYRSPGRQPTGHYPTRDQWIMAAINKFWRPAFADLGIELPEAILISVGFAPGQKAGSSTQAACYMRAVSGGLNTVFVSPEVDDLVQMLRIIGHELIHVADDTMSQHKRGGFFHTTAMALGYTGPFTDATFTAPELTELLMQVAADLGPFGHHKRFDLVSRLTLPVPGMPLRPAGHGGQGRIPGHGGNERNRWRKVTCATAKCPAGTAGYKARMTRLWALEHGTPKCPVCERSMRLEIKPEDLINE